MRRIDVTKLNQAAIDRLITGQKYLSAMTRMRVCSPEMPDDLWLPKYERTHAIKEVVSQRTAELRAAYGFELNPGHFIWLVEHHLEQTRVTLAHHLGRWYENVSDASVHLTQVRTLRTLPRIIEQRVRPVLNVTGETLDPTKQFEKAFDAIIDDFEARFEEFNQRKSDLQEAYDCTGSGAKKYLRKLEIEAHKDAAQMLELEMREWFTMADNHLTGRVEAKRRMRDEQETD